MAREKKFSGSATRAQVEKEVLIGRFDKVQKRWKSCYPGLRFVLEVENGEDVVIGWSTKKYQYRVKYKRNRLLQDSIWRYTIGHLEKEFERKAIYHFLRA